jgi:tryptophanyl-tRNA synthetase
LDDDEELATIERAYRDGSLGSADLKKRCIEVVSAILVDVQEVTQFRSFVFFLFFLFFADVLSLF